MHNKRIGRDDLLKIEVCLLRRAARQRLTEDSGPVLPRRLPGASTRALLASVVSGAPAVRVAVSAPRVAAAHPHAAAGATTPHARTTVVSATMTAVTATALEAPMETAR